MRSLWALCSVASVLYYYTSNNPMHPHLVLRLRMSREQSYYLHCTDRDNFTSYLWLIGPFKKKCLKSEVN